MPWQAGPPSSGLCPPVLETKKNTNGPAGPSELLLRPGFVCAGVLPVLAEKDGGTPQLRGILLGQRDELFKADLGARGHPPRRPHRPDEFIPLVDFHRKVAPFSGDSSLLEGTPPS